MSDSETTLAQRVGALYVHVPICAAKCRYCDFYSMPVTEALADRYVRAVAGELEMRGQCLGPPLGSIFLGGGTPTALGPDRLERLLGCLAHLADRHTEWSVEANPATLDADTLAVLRSRGVNRLNIGVQSFCDDELHTLGRLHNARQARQALDHAHAAGLDNIGLDLIYGIPGQTIASWRTSVRTAIACGIEHLSCYALSFEPGTPLEQMRRAGAIAETDDTFQQQCYRQAIEQAHQAGLEHYEISNFARGGRQCAHNLVYWNNQSYLGLGPAAASYVGGVRSVNRPDLDDYVRAIEDGACPPCSSEQLTGRALMAETVMLGLRLIDGLDRQRFRQRFGVDVADEFDEIIGRYMRMGALEMTATHLRISSAYLFVADAIMAEFM